MFEWLRNKNLEIRMWFTIVSLCKTNGLIIRRLLFIFTQSFRNSPLWILKLLRFYNKHSRIRSENIDEIPHFGDISSTVHITVNQVLVPRQGCKISFRTCAVDALLLNVGSPSYAVGTTAQLQSVAVLVCDQPRTYVKMLIHVYYISYYEV